jgi:hypothetical protein
MKLNFSAIFKKQRKKNKILHIHVVLGVIDFRRVKIFYFALSESFTLLNVRLQIYLGKLSLLFGHL